jgi:FkbM family methyltransferase
MIDERRARFGLSTSFPLLRLVYDRVVEAVRPKEPLSLRVHGRRMFVDTRDSGVTRLLLRDGHIEPAVTSVWRQIVRPADIVLDIGANLGYYTLLSANLVGNSGAVIAFEPVPENVALLRRTVASNRLSNVVVVESAVSDQEGDVTLYLDADNFGNHTMAPGTRDASDGRIQTRAVSLDGYLDPQVTVNAMKIDAEGAEQRIIHGARRILSEQDVQIVMEFWPTGQRALGDDPTALLGLLRSRGFTIYAIPDIGNAAQLISDQELLMRCDHHQTNGSVDIFLTKHAGLRLVA